MRGVAVRNKKKALSGVAEYNKKKKKITYRIMVIFSKIAATHAKYVSTCAL